MKKKSMSDGGWSWTGVCWEDSLEKYFPEAVLIQAEPIIQDINNKLTLVNHL